MTRPKVNPEKRQRTANACDSCKRRKQKCDGLNPCATCTKKRFTCTYDHDSYDEHSHSQPPSKRRAQQSGANAPSSSVQPNGSAPAHNFRTESLDPRAYRLGLETPSNEDAARSSGNFPPIIEPKPPEAKFSSNDDPANGEEEEAENHTMTRMLEDNSGRLTYVGDASTLSFLQIIRMIVETTTGPSPFTMDPERHRIAEPAMALPPDIRLNHLLPEKETALILIDSFFTHTHGLLEVFDEKSLLEKFHNCYTDPFTIDSIFLCHLNLVLAIGICLATPPAGTPEAAIIDSVRKRYPDQSEVFYLNAKALNNPLVGFADADFWSTQALLLMGMYMLTRSKRNTAFAYIGMAVRTSYALGLHREETFVLFSAAEQAARRNLWRSLFVLDRFLAASLGRPVAIIDEECSREVIIPSNNYSAACLKPSGGPICKAGLEAGVRSSHVVGIILKKVYLQRKVSTRLGQELADQCKEWPENLSPALHWRQASPNNPRQAIAILHSNIIYCHSIILLTRPFFLYLLSREIQQTRPGQKQVPQKPPGRMERFSEACVIASTHTVALAQNAYEGRYLPKRNPVVSHHLFAAALVIFLNEFAHPSSNALSKQCMTNSILILSYCGELDPSAKRTAHILTELHKVIASQAKQSNGVPPQLPYPSPGPTFTSSTDAQQPSILSSCDLSLTPIAPLPGATASPTTHPMPAYQPNAPSNPPPNNNNDSNPAPFIPPPMPYSNSFSGLLDITNTVLPAGTDPYSSASEEPIDFDALWQWHGDTSTPLSFDNPPGGVGSMGQNGKWSG